MTDDKNKTTALPQNAGNNKIENEKALSGQNPLHKGFANTITPKDIEGEQPFKESQTERD